MPIISHDNKDILFLKEIIKKDDGSPLMGEIDMYRRIYQDCEKSSLTWHFWHDLNLPISIKGQASIQIDFLLVCEKGMLIVEVKGGKISILNGRYYYDFNNKLEPMNRSPFDQADDYMYALMYNKMVNKSQIFISTICAFPHTKIDSTSYNPNADLGWKLWSQYQQEENDSFADFCVDVLENDKERKRCYMKNLSDEEIKIAIQSLTFNFKDDSKTGYNESCIKSILEWLKIDNLSTFESLRKNDRIVIEGGPGTGKTTIAKAYIDKFKNLRGIYLCWNKLLGAKIRFELEKEGLDKCKVFQYASFILKIKSELNVNYITYKEIVNGSSPLKLLKLLSEYRKRDEFLPFDYIIIDEAQDILDKGVLEILNNLTSITDNGLTNGRFIMFYDTEQAYNKQNKNIAELADRVSQHSAHFILDENKRVPNHKEIINIANLLLKDTNIEDFFLKIESSEYKSIKVNYFNGVRELIKHINAIKSNIEDNKLNWDDYVLLGHSSIKKTEIGESLYNRISGIYNITELTEENIYLNSSSLSFTSILSYKGLESKHVILILNKREFIDSFELYIGMTRAIIDLEILVLE